MTIDELIYRLTNIREHGAVNVKVEAWDPDSEQWEEVTGMTYGPKHLRFYTDEQ